MRIVPTSFLACVLFISCDGAGDRAPRPPNLLLVVVDTLRADLGARAAGRPAVPTPTLDRLAAKGVRFPLAFTHTPMTLPAHVALFSSRLPHQTGVLNNGQPLPAGLPLLAEHLRDAGYQTHAVTSLGMVAPLKEPGAADLSRGFDTFRSAGWGFISPAEDVNRRLWDVLDSLQEDAPFFLFAHYSDPHEPYNQRHGEPETARLLLDGEPLETLSSSVMSVWQQRIWMSPGRHRLELHGEHELRLRRLEIERDHVALPTEFVEGRLELPLRALAVEFDVPGSEDGLVNVRLWLTDHVRRDEVARRYASEVQHVDRQIGQLLDMLRARGLLDDTLVVLTSDHGESLGERGFIGHVKALYDELLHVPLVFRLPAERPGRELLAARAGQLVGLVDVVPTVLELLGLAPLEGQRGRSLLRPARAPVILAETHPPEAPRHLVCVRDTEWKLVYDVAVDDFELYDLRNDPGETADVFEAHTEVRENWQVLLRASARAADRMALDDVPLDAESRDLLVLLGYL